VFIPEQPVVLSGYYGNTMIDYQQKPVSPGSCLGAGIGDKSYPAKLKTDTRKIKAIFASQFEVSSCK
jgi:hypothetical protein